jgi:ribosomal RNA-processing protein 8
MKKLTVWMVDAQVPLADATVDIAVYCLALMGTTIREYVMEAHRVLKPRGVLKVAEVKSRFETESLGGIDGFVEAMHKLGFDCKQRDEKNKMFVLFEFAKSNRKPQSGVSIEFKACEYKRR